VSDSSVPPSETFRCDVARRGPSHWVHPVGELDVDSAHRLESALAGVREEGASQVVLDLRGLTFLDSTGLRLVLRWHNAAQGDGFAFAIVPGPEVVQRVFRLTGMDELVPVADPPPGE
jgi:anti-sigma B factor antagonist